MRQIAASREGQDLTDYSLPMGLIVIMAIVPVAFLGEEISQLLSHLASMLQSAL